MLVLFCFLIKILKFKNCVYLLWKGGERSRVGGEEAGGGTKTAQMAL